ncbi:MAG: hypothetical protein ACFFAN_13380 [Promethearchaeota archaeon]
MAEIFTKSNENNNSFEELCEIFLLYFDETIGHVPFLIHPDESIKDDPEKMNPINIHSIWFLDIKDHERLDRIDLEYNGKIYFAKKLLTPSKRKKRRSGLYDESFETIVIIIALPADMDVFGGDLLNQMTNTIIKYFESTLYQIIESEVLKYEIIKTTRIKQIIKKGDFLKKKLRDSIKNTCKEYFSSIVKQIDNKSIKLQKVISFLSIKGIDISHIVSNDQKAPFSNIRLFDLHNESKSSLEIKIPFEILNLEVSENNREIEILVKNKFKKDMNDFSVRVTFINELFEKEILNQKIDLWLSEEEILFIFPIISQINEYFFFITQESNKKKVLSKKIDLNKLKVNFIDD